MFYCKNIICDGVPNATHHIMQVNDTNQLIMKIRAIGQIVKKKINNNKKTKKIYVK